MNISDKFELLLWSISNKRIIQIIRDYNENCIKEGRKQDKLKGYSGKNKDNLIEFLITPLSLSEKEKIVLELLPEFIRELINDTYLLMKGKDKREQIKSYEKLPTGIGFLINIKGLQWDVEATVQIIDGVMNRECSCRIGQDDGLCRHQFAIFLHLFKNGQIDIKNFPLEIKINQLDEIIGLEETPLNSDINLPKDELCIKFSDDYTLLVDQEMVTMKWGGRFPGEKTVDISLEKEDLDSWICKKTLEKLLKTIHVKNKSGYPRILIVDEFGVISKIMSRPKMVEKILKKFRIIEKDLPVVEEELEMFLRRELEDY